MKTNSSSPYSKPYPRHPPSSTRRHDDNNKYHGRPRQAAAYSNHPPVYYSSTSSPTNPRGGVPARDRHDERFHHKGQYVPEGANLIHDRGHGGHHLSSLRSSYHNNGPYSFGLRDLSRDESAASSLMQHQVKMEDEETLRQRDDAIAHLQSGAGKVQKPRSRSLLVVIAGLATISAVNFGYYSGFVTRTVAPSVRHNLNAVDIVFPGGFKSNGVCNFTAMKEQEETIDLGVFPKHGFHVTDQIPKDCTKMKASKVGRHSSWYRRSTGTKMLAVRDQASFYKSAYNHVCNKKTDAKEKWRKSHDINCSREEEFVKLLALGEYEIGVNPFLLKEIIMRSKNITRVLLVDYTCTPHIVNSLCDTPMPSYESMPGSMSNSAIGQNYTDFWSLHGYAPFTPANQVWDDIYALLSKVCCLELVRI